MAISAITTDLEIDLGGTYTLVIGTFTPDNSWLAAGEVISITGHSSNSIRSARFESKGGYIFRLDNTLGSSVKVLAYYGDNNNAADGPLIAVPDTTDISAIGAVEGWFLVEN